MPGVYGAQPGISALAETSEKQITWGRPEQIKEMGVTIDSTAVDASNTSLTTTLQAGLVLGKQASDGNYYQYDPDATDGTEVAVGILLQAVDMLDPLGVAVDRDVSILVGGNVRAEQCILLDAQARSQLAGKILFDDDLPALPAGLFHPKRVVPKAADYTVLAADNGSLFLATTGAVVFTLPTKAAGLTFMFYNTVDAAMSIISAGSADDILADGDAAADTVAFSTTSHKIGSACLVTCVNTAASTLKWLVFNLGATVASVS